MIGSLVARAFYDGRVLDLPFAEVFWKMVLKEVSL
jgi:hypothetical protein